MPNLFLGWGAVGILEFVEGVGTGGTGGFAFDVVVVDVVLCTYCETREGGFSRLTLFAIDLDLRRAVNGSCSIVDSRSPLLLLLL